MKKTIFFIKLKSFGTVQLGKTDTL